MSQRVRRALAVATMAVVALVGVNASADASVQGAGVATGSAESMQSAVSLMLTGAFPWKGGTQLESAWLFTETSYSFGLDPAPASGSVHGTLDGMSAGLLFHDDCHGVGSNPDSPQGGFSYTEPLGSTLPGLYRETLLCDGPATGPIVVKVDVVRLPIPPVAVTRDLIIATNLVGAYSIETAPPSPPS
jgi:hypothetical protein